MSNVITFPGGKKNSAEAKALRDTKQQADEQRRQRKLAEKKEKKNAKNLDEAFGPLDNKPTSGISPGMKKLSEQGESRVIEEWKADTEAIFAPTQEKLDKVKAERAQNTADHEDFKSHAQNVRKEIEEEIIIQKGSPGDQKAGYKEGVEPEKGKADGKESKGVFAHLKQDWDHTKAAFSEASEVIGGGAKTVDGADSITDSAEAYKQLKKTGGDYLSNMGRGHKGLGVAKLGAYMVGTSMLVDMLNPFDDD